MDKLAVSALVEDIVPLVQNLLSPVPLEHSTISPEVSHRKIVLSAPLVTIALVQTIHSHLANAYLGIIALAELLRPTNSRPPQDTIQDMELRLPSLAHRGHSIHSSNRVFVHLVRRDSIVLIAALRFYLIVPLVTIAQMEHSNQRDVPLAPTCLSKMPGVRMNVFYALQACTAQRMDYQSPLRIAVLDTTVPRSQPLQNKLFVQEEVIVVLGPQPTHFAPKDGIILL
jgi:hypothetical protein